MSIVVALLLIGATSAWGVQSFLDKQQAEGAWTRYGCALRFAGFQPRS